MRSLKSLLCAFALMLVMCLAAPASAQCNGGVCVGGFSAFGFGGPVFVPFGGGFVAPGPINRGFDINSRGFRASGNGGANVEFTERRGPAGRVRFRSFRSN